jgi:outer membrane lipoprotein-sorting protein
MARRSLTLTVCLLAWLALEYRVVGAQAAGPQASMAAQGADTVESLVAKNLEAKGGLDKLRAVQSIKQTGRITIQSMAAVLTVYAKRPNLMRQEIAIAGQTIVSGYDGVTPWLVNPLTGSSDPIVVSGPEADMIKDQADIDGPLVDYKTKGYKVEFVGAETLNGKAVKHLRITSPTQHVQQCYLDAATGLETKIVSEVPSGTLEQELSDYREVNGLKMPFAAKTLSNGVLLTDLAFDRIEINVTIPAPLFKMPGKVSLSLIDVRH